MDPDRAPGPAAHLLDGDRSGRDEARGPRLLPARPGQLGAGGSRQRGRYRHQPQNTSGLASGQQVQIGTGSAAETRTIAHITNSGATGPRVPGKIGNAVQLSGNGEYVDLPDGIVSGLHDFTVSAWVNPSANSAWSRVFDFGTGTNDYMFLTLSAGGGPMRFAITTSGMVRSSRSTPPARSR